MAPPIDDWISRTTIPDVYPRRDDPFRPGASAPPASAPWPSMVTPDQLIEAKIWDGWLTTPTDRPIVYQRAMSYSIAVTTTPQPLTKGAMRFESMILNVPTSPGGTSAFYGYGSAVTATSGIEVQPGVPIYVRAENDREPWEIQRMVEIIAAMMAADRGIAPPGPYRAPRVVFNANEYWVVSTGSVTMAVLLFLVPEYQ